MSIPFLDMLKRKLIIVTGKGGVGKSLIAAAVARVAATRGANVLVMEIGEAERMAAMFNAQPSRGEVRRLDTRIDGLSCHQDTAQETMAVSIIKLRFLYTTLIRSKLFKNFIDAVPGLHDMVLLNQVRLYAEQEAEDGHGPYDMVILDAPATGHALSLLRVPELLRNIIGVGPLRRLLDRITILLEDPQAAVLLPVALAEDLPVTETLEFLTAVRERLGIAFGPVVANNLLGISGLSNAHRLMLRTPSANDSVRTRLPRAGLTGTGFEALAAAHDLFYARYLLQKKHLFRLMESGQTVVPVPRFQTNDEAATTLEVAAWLLKPSTAEEL
ncbi:hypothetical protein JW905_17660 [bacterium]|nr:hypothetical protein [candidate division CSSED10-310 bacterium]